MTVTLRIDGTASASGLLLRPWTDADAEDLVEVYRDPMIRQRTRLPVESPADAVRWLAVQRQGWSGGTRLSFAVLEDRPGAGHQLVANVVLKRNDPRSGSAEVGYWTAAHARGRGVAPRALNVLADWAFATFTADGLQRLWLLHQVDNVASCRVAEKTRFRFHRLLPARSPYPLDGHLHMRRGGFCRG